MDSRCSESKSRTPVRSKWTKTWNDSVLVDNDSGMDRLFGSRQIVGNDMKNEILEKTYNKGLTKKPTLRTSYVINQERKLKEISKENEWIAAKIRNVKSTINFNKIWPSSKTHFYFESKHTSDLDDRIKCILTKYTLLRQNKIQHYDYRRIIKLL